MAALLEDEEEDAIPITEEELRCPLARGKATAPGDDGITYSVLRLLQRVPGNPLLCLYNLFFSQCCAPPTWTCSSIVPIPMPGTHKFRHVSLTSCFSKIMERILLFRLLYKLESELSPCLFGFLPRRGTQRCCTELYSHLSSSSVVAFIDLNIAFDVANRDIILDQLLVFGIKEHLLKTVNSALHDMNIIIPEGEEKEEEEDSGPPPWMLLAPEATDRQGVLSSPLIWTLRLEAGWADGSLTLPLPHIVSFAGSWMQSAFCALMCIQAAIFCSVDQARDLQRVESVTIRHYDSFCYHPFKYLPP
ncbi:Retrovirus-related Pol polyprotein from type-1 retrotransposable element R2 [Portunus trituberculatus]|uniref:Retrovirus-related Pol polyprotein from type-1 retrotransposable element R2 n=1 Tax=Portunus trituberculatus TaxID=210409 RepID=A0A5B7GM20_PORTR|nr:Retrovirus-related Pol polyprotein from type-1 retrotransposable element R2 [Portunus trituberculatus]